MQRDQAADVARQFYKRDVAGIQNDSRNQIETLLRAGSHYDLRRLAAFDASFAEQFRYCVDECALPTRWAILKCKSPALSDDPGSNFSEFFGRKSLVAWSAGSERDYLF